MVLGAIVEPQTSPLCATDENRNWKTNAEDSSGGVVKH